MTARTDCSWNAASNASWITITNPVTATQGNGTVYYSVAANPNPGTVRKGSISVAGQSVTISQGTVTTTTTKRIPPGKKK